MTQFKDMTNDMNVIACRGCCNYPNSKVGIAAVVLGILGYILSIPAAHGCRYFKQQVTSTRYFYFGLFSYQNSSGVCLSWSDASEFTASWKFARAMAIIATTLGAIVICFTLSLSCVSMPNLIMKIMTLTYLLAGLCLILTMVANANCNECSLAGGGILAIIAPILYLCTAIIIFKLPLYDGDNSDASPATKTSKVASGEEVTITVTEMPDGSKKTVTTTIDKYGNKTIEETIETPGKELEEEDDVQVSYLPDGSIKTTRVSYDEDGSKIVHETIEKPQV